MPHGRSHFSQRPEETSRTVWSQKSYRRSFSPLPNWVEQLEILGDVTDLVAASGYDRVRAVILRIAAVVGV